MKELSKKVPGGVQDYLPSEYKHKKTIINKVYDTFKTWGYKGVETPILEYMDVFDEGKNGFARNKMFKLTDNEGDLLVLRPDITLPITRLSSSLLKDKVLRLCYDGDVFHFTGDESSADLKEFPQQGVELMGESSASADAEVIALAITALKDTGLSNFMIEIGQVEFFKGLMEEAGFTTEQIEQMRQYVESKNTLAMEMMMQEAELTESIKNRILELPTLYGDEDVLNKASTYSKNKRCRDAVSNLIEIWDMLKAYGVEKYVSIDLGMVQSINYYTGIIFKGLTDGVGYPILNGGRYDNLMADMPATGFALNLKPLLIKLERQGKFIKDSRMVSYVGSSNNESMIAYLTKARAAGDYAAAFFGTEKELISFENKVDGSTQAIWIDDNTENVLWRKENE